MSPASPGRSENSYRFYGAIALDRLVSGSVNFLTSLASPTGTALTLEAEIALGWEVAA
jgi:hypothetical protein